MLNGCYLCKREEEMADHILLSLFQSSHVMIVNLCSLWSPVGDVLLIQKCTSKREGILCWEEEEEKLGEQLLLCLFGSYGKREMGECLETLKRRIKQSFMYNFMSGLECI